MRRTPLLLGLLTALTLVVGGLLGFFFAMVTVFADGGAGERAVAIALTGVLYGVAGLGIGALWPGRKTWWTAWLTGPALVLLFLYSLRETNGIPLHAFVAATVVLGSWIGISGGDRLRAKR